MQPSISYGTDLDGVYSNLCDLFYSFEKNTLLHRSELVPDVCVFACVSCRREVSKAEAFRNNGTCLYCLHCPICMAYLRRVSDNENHFYLMCKFCFQFSTKGTLYEGTNMAMLIDRLSTIPRDSLITQEILSSSMDLSRTVPPSASGERNSCHISLQEIVRDIKAIEKDEVYIGFIRKPQPSATHEISKTKLNITQTMDQCFSDFRALPSSCTHSLHPIPVRLLTRCSWRTIDGEVLLRPNPICFGNPHSQAFETAHVGGAMLPRFRLITDSPLQKTSAQLESHMFSESKDEFSFYAIFSIWNTSEEEVVIHSMDCLNESPGVHLTQPIDPVSKRSIVPLVLPKRPHSTMDPYSSLRETPDAHTRNLISTHRHPSSATLPCLPQHARLVLVPLTLSKSKRNLLPTQQTSNITWIWQVNCRLRTMIGPKDRGLNSPTMGEVEKSRKIKIFPVKYLVRVRIPLDHLIPDFKL